MIQFDLHIFFRMGLVNLPPPLEIVGLMKGLLTIGEKRQGGLAMLPCCQLRQTSWSAGRSRKVTRFMARECPGGPYSKFFRHGKNGKFIDNGYLRCNGSCRVFPKIVRTVASSCNHVRVEFLFGTGREPSEVPF